METILINLMVSLILAVATIPVLEFMFIKRKNKKQKKAKKELTNYVQDYYEKVLKWTFRNPWTTICGAVAITVMSCLLIAPNMKVRMMPVADRDMFAVEITLPATKGWMQGTKSFDDRSFLKIKLPCLTTE